MRGLITFLSFMVGLALLVRWITRETPPSPAAEPAAIMADVQTARPTIEPSSTPDYQATVTSAQSMADATSQAALQTVSVAQAQALDDQQKAIWAQEAAVKAQEGKARADADKEQALAMQANIRVTEEVLAITQTVLDLKVIAATQAQPALITANLQAQADASRAVKDAQIGPYVAPLAALSLIIMLVCVALFLALKVADRWYQRSLLEHPIKKEPTYQTVSLTNSENPNVIYHIPPPPTTVQKFTTWATALLYSGWSAAVDAWETKDSPFLGKEYRNGLYVWAVRNDLLKRDVDGRQVPSDRGRAVLEKLLESNPILSPDTFMD